MAAMLGAAGGGSKEEWEPDSGATFHMPHTRVGMTAYKKAPRGMTVEVANWNFLPLNGFETLEVGPDQPGSTTKLVSMDAVAYMPGLSRSLVSTLKAVEQWGKPLIYNKMKAVLGLLGKESLAFNFCPGWGFFSATGVRRTRVRWWR